MNTQFLVALGQDSLLIVQRGHAHEHTHPISRMVVDNDPTVLKSFPRDLEKKTLLRVE